MKYKKARSEGWKEKGGYIHLSHRTFGWRTGNVNHDFILFGSLSSDIIKTTSCDITRAYSVVSTFDCESWAHGNILAWKLWTQMSLLSSWPFWFAFFFSWVFLTSVLTHLGYTQLNSYLCKCTGIVYSLFHSYCHHYKTKSSETLQHLVQKQDEGVFAMFSLAQKLCKMHTEAQAGWLGERNDVVDMIMHLCTWYIKRTSYFTKEHELTTMHIYMVPVSFQNTYNPLANILLNFCPVENLNSLVTCASISFAQPEDRYSCTDDCLSNDNA